MSTYSLSGSGVQALTADTTALHVTITTLSPFGGIGHANPANHYHQALLRPGDGTGFWAPIPVEGGPQWIGLPNGTDRIGYSCEGGSVISVTEVIGGTSPFAGPPGSAGATGATGATGAAGAAGAAGAVGAGVPTGGTTGQALEKASSADYDTHWVTPSGGGGTPTVVEAIPASNVAVFANTLTTVCSFSLTAGDWIVEGNAMGSFTGASHGEYQVTDGSTTYGGARDVNPSNLWYVETPFRSRRFTLAETTTVFLKVMWEQNGNVYLNTTTNSWGPATVMHALKVG